MTGDKAVELINEWLNLAKEVGDMNLNRMEYDEERYNYAMDRMDVIRKEINDLKNKIINLQDELKVKTEQMTSLLLENKEKTFLLEQKKDQTKEINQLKEQLDREKKEQLNEIEKLKNELEKEKNKGFFARLFSK